MIPVRIWHKIPRSRGFQTHGPIWQEEKEEGFPAGVKILCDRSAIKFLDLESLISAA